MSSIQESSSKADTPPANTANPLSAESRLQQLETNGQVTPVENAVSVMIYFNSTTHMIKKADSQYASKDLENALLSYLKFLDLFRNKVQKHVDIKRVPLTAKASNQYYQRHAEKRVNDLRAKLLHRYRQMAALHQDLETYDAIRRQSNEYMNYAKTKSISTREPMDKTAFDRQMFLQLRTIVVPKQLPTVFQIVTQTIRSEKFSTWATLMGKLEGNDYVITHLVSPIQDEREDEQVVESPCKRYAKQHQLVILGWIHSHRPASCYMSCADLHTQRVFQNRLPEAVAIVCAPLFTQVEFFTLLRFGMDYIGGCRKTGTHSHHADKPLYSVARHVKVVHNRTFELVDLFCGEHGNIY